MTKKNLGSEKFRVKWIYKVRLTFRFGWEHGSIASGLLPPREKVLRSKKKVSERHRQSINHHERGRFTGFHSKVQKISEGRKI